MKTKAVAALCERRWKNAPAPIERRYREAISAVADSRYKTNQSVVAAVYDRRWENQIPAVTDSRYNPNV